MDGGERFSREQNRHAAWFPHNPNHFFLPRLLSPPERARWPVRRPAGGAAPLHVCSSVGDAGECAIIEQSRCDTLSRSLSRSTLGLVPVSLGSPSWTLMRSDLTTAGLGKSRGRFFYYARVSQIWGSFHLSFDPVLIASNPNYFLLFMR
jgi:hypothetical protein